MNAFRTAPTLLLFCSAALASETLHFEPNVGQTSTTVSFISRWSGHAVFLTCAGETLKGPDFVWKMAFSGANPHATAVGLDRLEARSNYLLGSAESWHTGVTSYARVEYRDIYPGIDLIYYGDQTHLHYDFVIAPGADPSQIALHFDGAREVHTDGRALSAHSAAGEWHHTNPEAYQLSAGNRSKVQARFIAVGTAEAAFAIEPYDRTQALVMTYSTYLGGSGQDSATSLAVDGAGNAYVAGWAESLDFPEAAGMRLGAPSGVDAYVAKLNASGRLLFITYLGGSGEDRAFGVAVDSSGCAVIAGSTYSANFPIVNGAQPFPGGGRDGFVAKLNASGSALVFSTYLGGIGSDSANAVALDAQGNIYVAGETTSTNFPILNASQPQPGGGDDAFIAKFSSTGSRLYGTYFGGTGDDRATAIATDGTGSAYITGSTYSPNLMTVNAYQSKLGGGQDAFAAKLTASGSALVYSTYLGGSGGGVSAPESGNAIAVDAAGCAYIAGTTSSANFPALNPSQSALAGSQDAFVIKLIASGNALVYSTYMGGASIDVANAIAVDASGEAYVGGYTASTDFPVVDALQSSNAGSYDGFVATLNSAGSVLVMGTYIGGTGSDNVNAIALDADANIYVAGQTFSPDFPVVAAIQISQPAAASTFVASIPASGTAARMATPPPASTLAGAAVTFTWNGGTLATAYRLQLGTTQGTGNIYDAQFDPSVTSETVGGIPTTDDTIYVRLWTQLASAWQYHDYTYNAAKLGALATMTIPAPGATLTGSTVTFTWTAGSGASGYWLDVGTVQGQGNISAGQLSPSVTSETVNGIPTTGGTIYVRLWTLLAGAWQYHDYTYTAANLGTLAAMTTPAPGTTLSGSTVTFTWAAALSATAYWLDVGTVQGAGNISAGQLAPSITSETVNGIPTTGGIIYVRLWTQLTGAWQYYDYTYNAPNLGTLASVITPVSGATLAGSSVTFTWTAVSSATAYWLDVGTAQGQGNISAGQLAPSITSKTVNGIPTTGGTLYVRLWTQLADAWQYYDYTYTTTNMGTLATMITPVPGATLAGSIVTFTWTAASGATAYWLDVGTIQGQGNISAGQLAPSITSRTVNGIPVTGGTIYVRLWAQLAGAWQYHDYTYTAQ